jgi:hypothetical protein
MESIELIRTLESTHPTFYEHFRVSNSDIHAEVQWINQSWRYRLTPYQGDWVQISSPLMVPNIEVEDLRRLIGGQILTYYAYHSSSGGNVQFQLKKIERLFGQKHCQMAVVELEEFGQSLVKIVGAMLSKKTGLKVVPGAED